MGICDVLLDLIGNFLENRFQRVVLNGQSGYQLKQVFHKNLISELFFLIYINDLPIDILSTVKLFADDTSVFSIIHNKTTAHKLNEDLEKKAEWVHKWKMSFHPNLNNQAQEVIFLND